ncbi:MAG: hypothetical protein ACQEP1_00420 [Nanobdellota archaeon]
MNNIIKKDILKILTKVREAINDKDVHELSRISNQINHNSSIFQDEDSITLAVVVYSLSKLLANDEEETDRSFSPLFRKAKTYLESDQYEKYRECIKDIIDRISNADTKLRRYILHVYNQAEIKKGSKLFYNGLSLPRVAELMNLSQWELMAYIGKTNIADSFGTDERIKSRINHARKIFGIK